MAVLKGIIRGEHERFQPVRQPAQLPRYTAQPRNVGKYPLKIVVSVEGDTVTVITNYTLKKGRKK